MLMADSKSQSHCQVCMAVFVEPVILPCDHCLCKPCFDSIITTANLQCPFCRRRIGSWARLHARKGTLVNTEKWEYMKANFTEEVNARLSGKTTPKKSRREGQAMRESFSVVLANTGEIRKEYELELQKLREEREKEEQASEKLIKEMLAKDKRELAAFKVANKENKPSHNINQSTKLQLPRRSSSIDSITGEYNRHFKPIVRYPRTPPRPSDKEKGYPETIKVTPCPQTVKRLDFASSSSPAPDVSSSNEKCGSNSSTTHSRVKDEPIVKEGASIPSCSTSADHTFLRPRHSSCLSADDHSNDGMSIVSSSTGTSMSNSQLRIATTSPIIPDSPGDTVGRSRTSSNNTSERWSPCSTESRKVNRHRRSKQHRDSTKNGYVNTKSSKTLTNGHTNGTAASSSASGARKRRVSRSSSAQSTISYRSEDFNQNVNGEVGMANGSHDSSGPAFVDPDELYAKKLQQIYKMEKRYCMPTLRFEGSGNEYNTRKRKRDELRN